MRKAGFHMGVIEVSICTLLRGGVTDSRGNTKGEEGEEKGEE